MYTFIMFNTVLQCPDADFRFHTYTDFNIMEHAISN